MSVMSRVVVFLKNGMKLIFQNKSMNEVDSWIKDQGIVSEVEHYESK